MKDVDVKAEIYTKRYTFALMEENVKKHRSGFVNIIGNPNVGKSTLMNALVGQELSIITSKAQTTRHRILGVVSGDDFQVVLSDTPGIIRPAYRLQENMMEFVKSAFEDADILLYMIEPGEKELKDPTFYHRIETATVPVLLVINKIDTIDQNRLEEVVKFWSEKLPRVEIHAISAREKFAVKDLLDRIVELLPEGPAYYPKDTLTDKPERFFVNEIIRQKILLNYTKEVPYSVEVETESFQEEDDIIRIRAVIYVERASQRPIIIGNKGAAIKKVGIEAREDMERFFGKKVFLETYVKVNDGWRSNRNSLRHFGYEF